MSQFKHGQKLSIARRITLTAIFAALAFVAISVFRFNVQFLTFDLKDAVITLASLFLGPVAALTVSLLVALLELITYSDTGWYGFIMNFASSAAFSVVCAVVYAYRKKLSGAIVGLCSAVVVMVGVMIGLNLVVTPFYMGAPRSAVAELIPTLLLPFNIVKGMVNAALVLILYKPVHHAMQGAKLLPRSAPPLAESDPALKRKRILHSVLLTVAGCLLLAASIAVFYYVLHGSFEWLR